MLTCSDGMMRRGIASILSASLAQRDELGQALNDVPLEGLLVTGDTSVYAFMSQSGCLFLYGPAGLTHD